MGIRARARTAQLVNASIASAKRANLLSDDAATTVAQQAASRSVDSAAEAETLKVLDALDCIVSAEDAVVVQALCKLKSLSPAWKLATRELLRRHVFQAQAKAIAREASLQLMVLPESLVRALAQEVHNDVQHFREAKKDISHRSLWASSGCWLLSSIGVAK